MVAETLLQVVHQVLLPRLAQDQAVRRHASAEAFQPPPVRLSGRAGMCR